MILPGGSARWASRLSQRSYKATQGFNCRHAQKLAQKRGYANASGGGSHSTHKSSSDLPWAIGSLVVTVPSVFYLIQPQLQPKKSHSHGHGDEGHGNEHSEVDDHTENTKGAEEGGEEGGAEEGAAEAGGVEESGEEGGSSEGKEESGVVSRDQGAEEERADVGDDSGERDDEDKGEEHEGESSGNKGVTNPKDKGPDAEAHETESGGDVEGVQFKGATKDGEPGDTRKHIPDAKGGSKKRIESHYGKRQGEATRPEQDPDDKDLPATSKPAGKTGVGNQSSKQEGISNADTKHSTDVVNDPEKSTKGGGMPETAKVKGTVDPRA